MTRKFLIVRAHPLRDSFVNAAGDRCVASLKRASHEVREIDLYAEGFDPVPSAHEWQHRRDGLVPELAHYGEALRWATDLVLVYPTWYGGQPAMLKGWIDRVWVEGVAYHLEPGSIAAKGSLRNIRNIWAVTSHGSTKLMNTVQGEAGKHMLQKSLRLLCARRCRVRWIAFYGNDGATHIDRSAFLQRVSRVFSQLR